MAFRILGALIAVVLMVAFLSPPVLKLQDAALASVILIGVVMMLVDLWQSLQSKED